jgi:hypothetical protein
VGGRPCRSALISIPMLNRRVDARGRVTKRRRDDKISAREGFLL